MRRLLVTSSIVHCSPILATLLMEALSLSDTSVPTTATRRNIPEDAILYFQVIKLPNPSGRIRPWGLLSL
jgi:hypothetical protein